MAGKVIYQGGTGEITEKKSRFIATIQDVYSEEEAAAFIGEIKKKYWDARHNCFAFILGERQEVQRFSDDGEPQGTAGKPMLDVLVGAGLHNCAVVVTRYFGGVLLGTGGLVRAYSKAVQEGLENCVVLEKLTGRRLVIETDYNGLGKLQYLLGQRGIPVTDSLYSDVVKTTVLVREEEAEALLSEITEVTNGKATWEEEKDISFGFAGKEPVLF